MVDEEAIWQLVAGIGGKSHDEPCQQWRDIGVGLQTDGKIMVPKTQTAILSRTLPSK
jgi:hypothetical protein